MASRLRLQFLVVALVVLGLGVAWLEEPRPADARRGLPRGPAGSTCTGTGRSRRRSRGCGAPPPASRSCATSSTARPTTRRPVSDAISTGCATRNRYDLPLSAGVDPAGWTAGLRHFVDDRYRLVSSRTFDSALRSAVNRLRLTNLPVALTVSHGNHGWILTGFRATADPAKTSTIHGHERPGDRAALRPPEQERLRHGTEHEADDRPAQALLHALEIRPAGDDLGRPLRLDPARAGQGLGGRRCDCGTVAGRQRCTERRRESGAGRVTEPESGGDRRADPWRRRWRCSPATVLMAPEPSRTPIPSRQRTHPRLRSGS